MGTSSANLSRYYEAFHEERQKVGTVAVPERLGFVAAEVGTGKDVVELGCRYGDLLAAFVEGNRVTGVDIDRQALDVCAGRYAVVTQVANLNEALPFGDEQFDVVVLSEVLEHLPYPEITLSEIARICRPGGKLVGSVPNGARLRNRLRFLLGGEVDLDRTHLRHFSPRSLTATLDRFFERTRVIPVSGRYVGLSQNLFAGYLLFVSEDPRKG
jgi:SAM-dependent methyltransferase